MVAVVSVAVLAEASLEVASEEDPQGAVVPPVDGNLIRFLIQHKYSTPPSSYLVAWRGGVFLSLA